MKLSASGISVRVAMFFHDVALVVYGRIFRGFRAMRCQFIAAGQAEGRPFHRAAPGLAACLFSSPSVSTETSLRQRS
jgi:hypothetical protein